jgi:membrane associated rhomboid family serine protease
MTTLLINLLPPLAALLAGGAIGLAFGLIQDAARRRNEKRQKDGEFKSGWQETPGSFRRVAYLLIALALVQFLFPVLFAPGGISQWCVSGGVVIGYGSTLYRQLRRRAT